MAARAAEVVRGAAGEEPVGAAAREVAAMGSVKENWRAAVAMVEVARAWAEVERETAVAATAMATGMEGAATAMAARVAAAMAARVAAAMAEKAEEAMDRAKVVVEKVVLEKVVVEKVEGGGAAPAPALAPGQPAGSVV